jgi:hypothetical protein
VGKHLLVAVVALEEVRAGNSAVGGGVEVIVVAVLQLPHEEVAGVRLAVNADLRVRHQLSNIPIHDATPLMKWVVSEK